MANIMIFGKYPPIQGGVSRAVYWAAHDLAEAEHQVTLISNALDVESNYRQYLEPDDLERLTSTRHGHSIRLVNLDQSGDRFYIPYTLPYLSQMIGAGLREAELNKPDVIISYYFEPYGMAGAVVAKEIGALSVLIHAGSDLGRLSIQPDLHFAYRYMISLYSYIATGRYSAVRDKLLQNLGVPTSKCLYPGTRSVEYPFREPVDPVDVNVIIDRAEDYYRSLPFERELIDQILVLNHKPFSELAGPVVGVYGKVGRSKGTPFLIESLANLVESEVKLKFICMPTGQPEVLEKFYRLILERPHLAERTWCLPPCAPWKVPRFIDCCDIIFFLENNFDILFHNPRLPREIFSRGKCCVIAGEMVSNLGFSDILVHGENAVIVPDVRDIEQLTESIRWIVTDEPRRRVIALQSRGLSDLIERVSVLVKLFLFPKSCPL